MSLLARPLSELSQDEVRQITLISSKHRLQGQQALLRGDYHTALREFFSMIPYQDKLTTQDSPECAIGFIGLGEASLGEGRADAAEEALVQALKVLERVEFGGMGLGSVEDAAVARELMARVKEVQSRFKDARELRMRGNVDKSTRCSNLRCLSKAVEQDNLQFCGGCRCAWYCSPICQKSDWTRHKEFCKKDGAKAKAQSS